MIKSGDKVLCIKPEKGFLIFDTIYTVDCISDAFDSGGLYVSVIGVPGIAWVFKNRFVEIKEANG